MSDVELERLKSTDSVMVSYDRNERDPEMLSRKAAIIEGLKRYVRNVWENEIPEETGKAPEATREVSDFDLVVVLLTKGYNTSALNSNHILGKKILPIILEESMIRSNWEEGLKETLGKFKDLDLSSTEYFQNDHLSSTGESQMEERWNQTNSFQLGSDVLARDTNNSWYLDCNWNLYTVLRLLGLVAIIITLFRIFLPFKPSPDSSGALRKPSLMPAYRGSISPTKPNLSSAYPTHEPSMTPTRPPSIPPSYLPSLLPTYEPSTIPSKIISPADYHLCWIGKYCLPTKNLITQPGTYDSPQTCAKQCIAQNAGYNFFAYLTPFKQCECSLNCASLTSNPSANTYAIASQSCPDLAQS